MQENERRGLRNEEMLEDIYLWYALILSNIPEEQQPEVLERYLDNGSFLSVV